jgi:hypothetical protein
MTVVSVSGPGVRQWSQSGTRVQIWLEKTTDAVKLEMTCRLTSAPGKDGLLELPTLRIVPAQTQQTTVRISTDSGLILSPVPNTLRNLTTVSRPDEHDLVMTAAQSSYGGTWSIRPAACEASARMLTVVEARDRRLHFAATVLFNVRRGELRTVRLRLRDWHADPVELSLPGTMRRGAGGERTWTLELPPGVTREYRLTVRGSMPLSEAAAGVLAPDVTVMIGTPGMGGASSGSEKLDRSLAIVGTDLVFEGQQSLTAERDPSKSLAAWPQEAERLKSSVATLWKLPAERLPRDADPSPAPWKLRLWPRDRERPTETIQVFLAEQQAAVADGRHWLHEAAYWLRHEANAELTVVLPGAGRLVGASLDGVQVAPVQSEPTRLWLPLPRRPGVRCLRIRWTYDDEPLTAPNLDAPLLEGAREGRTLWTIHAPDGFSVENTAGAKLRSGPDRVAALDLYRAEAQWQIVQRLAAEFTDGTADAETYSELSAAQRRLYQYCRQADRYLALVPDSGAGETGPEGQPLGDWLNHLLKQNSDTAAASADLEKIRSEAERLAEQVRPVRPQLEESVAIGLATHPEAARLAGMRLTRAAAGDTALPERGTTSAAHADPGATAPVVVLRPAAQRASREAFLGAGLWLALLMAAWAVTSIPSLLRWTRPFWPEQLVLLGAVGWYLAGPRPVVLALLLTWLCVRLAHVRRVGSRIWRHRTASYTSALAARG